MKRKDAAAYYELLAEIYNSATAHDDGCPGLNSDPIDDCTCEGAVDVDALADGLVEMMHAMRAKMNGEEMK